MRPFAIVDDAGFVKLHNVVYSMGNFIFSFKFLNFFLNETALKSSASNLEEVLCPSSVVIDRKLYF